MVRKGISDLSAGHIHIASELGYRIKLIAQAYQTEQGIRLSVQPTMLPVVHPLAQIQDAFNAVQLSGNIVGDLLFTGRGAGELPTASAVVEDLAYLLTQPFAPHPAWKGLLIQFILVYIIAFVLESFLVGPIAKKLAFALPFDKSKKVLVILSMAF